MSGLEEGVFGYLWKSLAPYKVVAFSWTLLLDRIPTRSNLAIRNLLAPGDSDRFVLCGVEVETSIHIFLHCEVVTKVWRLVMNWLEFNFITQHNLFVHLECWSNEVRPKYLKRGVWLI